MKRKSDILDLDLGKALNKYQQTSLSSVRGGGMRIVCLVFVFVDL
jgi:hypothetical protein